MTICKVQRVGEITTETHATTCVHMFPNRPLVYRLVRFDEDHFGYLIPDYLNEDEMEFVVRSFAEAWAGKKLLIIRAAEFIDLTGQFEIVPISTAA